MYSCSQHGVVRFFYIIVIIWSVQKKTRKVSFFQYFFLWHSDSEWREASNYKLEIGKTVLSRSSLQFSDKTALKLWAKISAHRGRIRSCGTVTFTHPVRSLYRLTVLQTLFITHIQFSWCVSNLFITRYNIQNIIFVFVGNRYNKK